MKKIALVSLLAFAAAGAGAQTIGDALQFSEYNYYGTARTIAMGNAFTALGGDLGSIGINPAGSAVARYSQFTITPNVSIVSTGSQYSSTRAPVRLRQPRTAATPALPFRISASTSIPTCTSVPG